MAGPRKKIDDIVNQIKEVANSPIVTDDSRVEFLDSGSTLINLAASQKARNGGWARNRVINVVGDKSVGKSLISLEACANAFYNIQKKQSRIFPEVEKVSIVFNNVEGVLDFPVEEMYGKKFNESVNWIQIPIAESFGKDYQQRVAALKKGEFLLYVVDSLDALVTEASAKRMEQVLSDKKPDGSYGTEKAKFFSSEFFNHLCSAMKNKDCTLLCVSQVRENIGISFGERYYRTGGKALDFYCHQVAWLSTVEKMKKTFRGQERVYGVKGKILFKKSKVSVPFREAPFTVLFNYGLDNIGSLVDYLYGPKAKEIEWKNEKMKSQDFLQLLDNSPEDLELLKDMVEKDWLEIEEHIKPERKPRWTE